MYRYQCTPSPSPGGPPDGNVVAVGGCPGGQSASSLQLARRKVRAIGLAPAEREARGVPPDEGPGNVVASASEHLLEKKPFIGARESGHSPERA